MNYCSIKDAWGQNEYITNQFKKYSNQDSDKKPIETFSTENTHHKISNCKDFISHLNKCKKCQHILRDKYRPKILEKFSDIIETNKDVIVLILVGICIMLFFNLVNNITYVGDRK
jgi:hypothetical protein